MPRDLMTDVVEGAGALVGGYATGVLENVPAIKNIQNMPLIAEGALVLGSIFAADRMKKAGRNTALLAEAAEGLAWGVLGVLGRNKIYKAVPAVPNTSYFRTQTVPVSAIPVSDWAQPASSAGGMSVLEI